MPSRLRTRLGQVAVLLLVLGLAVQAISTQVVYGQSGFMTEGSSPTPPFVLVTLLGSLGTVCLALAVVAGAGFVASLVAEEVADRRLWIDAGFDEDDDSDLPAG